MNESVLLFASALVLGLIFSALPDAVNTEAFRRGVKGGFRPAFFLELGSCIGDMVWAVFALIGIAFLMGDRNIQVALGLIGASMLFYLAYRAFMDISHDVIDRPKGISSTWDFVTGMAVSLCNPMELALWLGIGGSAISVAFPDPVLSDFILFLAGYMTGSVIWCFLFTGLVVYGRRFLDHRLFRTVHLLCGLALVYLGLTILLSLFLPGVLPVIHG
jgi:chemosensory pili system protein ChpE